MRYCLFHYDGPAGQRPFDWQWIDKWCGIYGVHPAIVARADLARSQDRPPYWFRRLEEAVAHPDFEGHSFVWLDPEATHYWDEVELPKEDVVFCIGSDLLGFDGFEHEGQRVKLRPPNPKFEGEWYASMVVPLLFFEVYGT